VLIQLFKMEKKGRDKQMAEKTQHHQMLHGTILQDGRKKGSNRNGDESCCTIF
jgi:hypothetical protein